MRWINLTEQEWPNGLQHCATCGTDGRGFNPPPPPQTNACGHIICKYVDRKGSAAMVASVQSAGVAPEVNLRITTGKKLCKSKKGMNPGFETQGRHHQKSKTGVSVAPRKGLKIFFLKKMN